MATIETVTVYAASSDALAPAFLEAAAELGRVLAGAGLSIRYGGGGTGLMGAMADAALAAGGEIHGITPVFLRELEVSHEGLTSLVVVDDMRERKHLMLENSDAVVTLPGGCGTYEELFEAMTLKRLGQWSGPIVLVNTDGFYDGLLAFLDHSVDQGFMSEKHRGLWSVVASPAEVPGALAAAPAWGPEALAHANVSPQGASA